MLTDMIATKDQQLGKSQDRYNHLSEEYRRYVVAKRDQAKTASPAQMLEMYPPALSNENLSTAVTQAHQQHQASEGRISQPYPTPAPAASDGYAMGQQAWLEQQSYTSHPMIEVAPPPPFSVAASAGQPASTDAQEPRGQNVWGDLQ